MNWINLVVQLDRRHWLVIFIHPNGVHTVMDSHNFMDFIANEANITDD
ncbi:hypothetical protein FHX06_005976 [Rhizobium sp. BK512]|nr:hypothetical protein [Rhizobium sp. BK512]MBB3564612.1 hypothetical protein [Rhizobium sp. BK512]